MNIPAAGMPVETTRKLLFFGETLWDMLPSGPQPGGAPANAAVQARRAGADVLLVSAVGDDARGREMLARLKAQKLPLDGVQVIPGAATGIVDVTLAGSGIPAYHIRRDVAWDRIGTSPALREAASRARAFCFGTLAQRSSVSKSSLHELLGLAPPDCVRFLDINIRNPHPASAVIKTSLARADILKLNNEELPLLASWLGLPAGEDEFAKAAFACLPLRAILLTKGPRGAVVFERGLPPAPVPASPVEKIADTVGAGDAFSAGFLTSLLKGSTCREAARIGSDLAARVCQIAGAWFPAPP